MNEMRYTVDLTREFISATMDSNNPSDE
jgi:hypothetical protein